MEEKKFTTEDAIRFLDVLESENEDELTNVIEAIQDVEQKLREADYILQEFDKKQDANLNFFSPVGVYEEGEEKKNLLRSVEELNKKLPQLNDKLEQYKARREQLQFLRDAFLETQREAEKEEEASGSSEYPAVSKEQSLHILETQEYDRNRIARDLHDSSVQSLTSLVHKTELCMRLMDIDTIRVKLELQTMIETIKSIINGMREIIYDLRPMSLNNLGLAVTVDSYCTQLRKNYDMEVNFLLPEEEPELSSIWKVTLYRILQEACSNVVKHANASKIEIKLLYEGQNVFLEIKDNGSGFDTNAPLKPVQEEELHRFGLSMMRERAVLLGGCATIASVIGEGTIVTVKVPLKTEKEEKDGKN